MLGTNYEYLCIWSDDSGHTYYNRINTSTKQLWFDEIKNPTAQPIMPTDKDYTIIISGGVRSCFTSNAS